MSLKMCATACISLSITTLPPNSKFFFFFNDTATPEIYTLSLHDPLPIPDLVGNGREPIPVQAQETDDILSQHQPDLAFGNTAEGVAQPLSRVGPRAFGVWVVPTEGTWQIGRAHV